MVHYKEDIIQALEMYINHRENKDIQVHELQFLNFYCKKFGLSKAKYMDKIIKIFRDYMEENS